MGNEASNTLREILDQSGEYLRWLKEEGVGQIEVSRRIGASRQQGVLTMKTLPDGKRVQTAGRMSVKKTVSAELATEPAGSKPRSVPEIAAEIAGCKRCVLCRTRTKTVPGQGNLSPEILFVGEAPGADEDQQGLAFVGAAGQLLTRMILAMGLQRDEVFIANILKCRPPGNRVPTPEEMETCLPYLQEQIRCLQPKVIVALGATAVRGLLHSETGITKLRGTWQEFQGIPVMPTFHPAYLLRNPPAKREAWDDLQAVLHKVGRTPPPVKPVKA